VWVTRGLQRLGGHVYPRIILKRLSRVGESAGGGCGGYKERLRDWERRVGGKQLACCGGRRSLLREGEGAGAGPWRRRQATAKTGADGAWGVGAARATLLSSYHIRVVELCSAVCWCCYLVPCTYPIDNNELNS